MGDFQIIDRRHGTNPKRELVEAGGNPWIKVVINADDTVSVSAFGIPEQNVFPILGRLVQAHGKSERTFDPYSEPGPWAQDGVPLP